jgi:hypothetical protein
LLMVVAQAFKRAKICLESANLTAGVIAQIRGACNGVCWVFGRPDL